jgi:hypothetical protein
LECVGAWFVVGTKVACRVGYRYTFRRVVLSVLRSETESVHVWREFLSELFGSRALPVLSDREAVENLLPAGCGVHAATIGVPVPLDADERLNEALAVDG